MKTREINYVSEGDYGRWNGCLVRVPGMASKLFSYSKYASVRECRDNAREYRDWCVEQIGGWDKISKRGGGHLGLHYIPKRAAKRNKLSILGLYVDERIRRESGRKPRLICRVIAQLRINGIADMRAEFAFKRNTKRAAITLAYAARKRFERKRDRLLAARTMQP